MASDAPPIAMGIAMPILSLMRPIRTPPAPKPIMVRVNGTEAAPRAIPKSAWTADSDTTTDHIPTPPMVEISMQTPRRNQA